MKLIVWKSLLIPISLLVLVGLASAQPDQMGGANRAGTMPGLVSIATSPDNSHARSVTDIVAVLDGGGWFHQDGHGWFWDRDRDKDKWKNRDGGSGDPPDPSPEPSNMLSVGAALLIGGGVLASRRLRGAKKK